MLLMIFISGHTPRNVERKLTLGPFHSTTLTRLTQTKGLTAGVACRPPPPFARVGERLSRNTPTGAQLALIFRPPNISGPLPSPPEGGDTPPSRPPELHVLEQGRAEKGPLFSEHACNLAIGANGECFRPSLCLEWLPQVQGLKMTSKLVCGV